MSVPSGPNIESSETSQTDPAGAADVPLASLPLVADRQQTVVSSGSSPGETTEATRSDVVVETGGAFPSELLFGTEGSDHIPGGIRLGHFEISRRIGAGGMGYVFLAHDVLLRRPVALKVLKPTAAHDRAMLSRFQNEARSAALLQHDNIAQVYYIGEDRGLHYIASEYVEGRTVRDLIAEQGTLSPEDVVNYAIQTTLALNHMHSTGVIHRDIKPSNLIVTADGRVKIVDLGLARRDSPDSVCDITVAGSTLGTFDYLAPEQARDPRQADIRSDLYSLGCTLYHMLTGQPPYPEGTALQKLLDHQGKEAPDPADINDKVPEELADIVLTLLKTDPEDRYQTPSELLTDLIDVAGLMGLQGIPADGVVWKNSGNRTEHRSSGSLLMATAVLAICAAALIMHLVPPARSTTTSIPPVDPPRFQRPVRVETDGDGTGAGRIPPILPGSFGRMPDLLILPGTAAPVASAVLQWPSDLSDPSAAEPAAVPIPPRTDVFVALAPDGTRTPFSTLRQALSHIRSVGGTGHVVELDYSGLPPEPVHSLPRLDGVTVRISAARGRQPVIEYRGDPDQPGMTSLFRLLNGSSLTLENVTLRLIPDPERTNLPWTLFDCTGTAHLDLRNCAIQVDSEPGTRTDVFRFNETPSSVMPPEITVRLDSLAVSGSADLFRVAAQISAFLQMDNCGVAVTGSLIHNTGGTTAGPAGTVRLELNHVTAITGAPLLRIIEPEGAPQRVVSVLDVTSRASVFCASGENGILVESRGPERLDELQEQLIWTGDFGLYAGYSAFWILVSRDSGPAGETFRFSDWQAWWNRHSEGAERNAQQFEWTDAAWRSSAGMARDLRLFRTEWFAVDPARFHTTRELPLADGREIPGAAVHRLPELPAWLPGRPGDPEL